MTVYASNGRQAVTDREGHFTLTQLPLAVVSLWFQRHGFVATEVLAQATTATGRNTATFYLDERQLPPDQPLDSIHRVQSAMVSQGERGLYRIALLDAPDPTMDVQGIQGWRARFDSAHGALYYPWLMAETGNGLSTAPPCGHLAGVFARAEREHGLYRAPANIALRSCKGLTQIVEDNQHGALNAQGINVLRLLAGRGIHPFGARSLASAPAWRFINVRRLVNALEQTLEQQLQWAVFEPNSVALREAVRFTLLNLLNRLWRQGALAGESADQAFSVKVDTDNNPARLRDLGRFLAEIQVAPSVPFEFITLRLGRTLDALEVQENAP
ncbi:phage tail sheath family protein [Marinobacter lacisalsi]|uniref:Phage tail sheath family protein n=1 Tax=Marinobacter lacisalsi TaxID=475979 RepID=A0ABV8QKY2_9GAMM